MRETTSSRILRKLHEHAREMPGRELSTWELSLGLLRLSRVAWPTETLAVVPGTRREGEDLRRAARASVLASASYGVFGALFASWSLGPLHLLATTWRLLCGLQRPQVAAFESHTRALGLRAADLLHAQWQPHMGREEAADALLPAHLIVVDHATQSVVLVVRGTLELDDVLTDLEFTPTRHERRLMGWGCHGGMVRAAQRLVDLHEETLRATLRRHRGYALTVTGHSMGAGIASFVGILLRRR